MPTTICESIAAIKKELAPFQAKLVAVSKTHPQERLLEAYACGQLIFGENRVQELASKAEALPADIEWHFIGHLQRNKVKYIAPFVHMIHAVDSWRLLEEIDKRAAAENRTIKVLLQCKIAQEDSKYGLSAEDLNTLLTQHDWQALQNVQICGLMGMATFTDDEAQVRREFQQLKHLFTQTKERFFANDNRFTEISMGMSGDYPVALEEGSTMVRIGSKIFGHRDYA